MDIFDQLAHLANFLAPALFMALGMAGALRIGLRRWPLARVERKRIACYFGAGASALALALLVLGRDGTVAGYALMCVACAVAAWLSVRRE